MSSVRARIAARGGEIWRRRNERGQQIITWYATCSFCSMRWKAADISKRGVSIEGLTIIIVVSRDRRNDDVTNIVFALVV